MKVSHATQLWRYWAESPSVHDLVAAYLGVEAPGAAGRVSSQEELLAFALFAGGGIGHG